MNFTGSSIGRVMACPSSEALPHIDFYNDFADAGLARHKYLQHVDRLGVEEALLLVPSEHRDMCREIDIEDMPLGLSVEVAFAWDWETGIARELGMELDRDYSDCSETEIAGTLDVVGVGDLVHRGDLLKDWIYVGDYKGWQHVPAKDNTQLLFGALCSTQVYGKSSALVEIINVRDGHNWRSKSRVDMFAIVMFARRLKATALEVLAIKSGKQPIAVREGKHCRYCPAKDSCPAKVGLLRSMINGQEADELEMQLPLDDNNARHAYKNLQLMKSITRRAETLIYAFAAERPIDLGNGMMFGSYEKLGNEILDGDITYEVIREAHGQEAADIAMKRKATKSGIKKAIRSVPKVGTYIEAEDAILEAVRKRGGSKKKLSVVTGEYKLELKE